jgi:antitoxin PrlF
MVALITSKFQMVVPRSVREHLGLHPGDKLDFVIEKDGQVVVRALTSEFTALRGMVKHRRKSPATLAEMDQAVSRNAGRGRGR